MPGLVGVIDFSGNSIDVQKLLEKMCNAVKHEDWYAAEKHVDYPLCVARISTGLLNPQPQPIFNEDKSLCILMDGEIYGYEAQQESISSKHKFSVGNDADFILHMYEQEGKKSLQDLNGSFNATIWNKKTQELLIINDRYGLRPLYYAENAGKLLYGPEVKAILADPTFNRQVNDSAVADFFAFEHIMGDKTLFQGIRVLPPASVLSYRRNKMSLAQYWHFTYNEQNRSEEYIASELVNRFRKAVERRVQGKLRKGLFLSGGLDSRAVLAASNEKLYTITFGKKGCEDARIAREVANKMSVKNEFMEITGDEYPKFAEKGVYLSDGLINSYHFHAISFMDKIKDRIDVVFDGLALDLTLGGTYLKKDIFSSNQKSLPKTLFKMCSKLFTEDMAKQLFTKEYYKKIEGQAFDSFKEELEKVKEKNIANRADHFFITNHVRRFTIMSSPYIRSKIELLTPTYDNDFFEFILTVPPQLRYNHRIYRKFLKKLNKKMAKIAYQKTGIRPDSPEIFWKIGFLARAVNYKLKRLLKMRTHGAVSIPDKLTYIEFNDWIRKKPAFRDYVKKILLSDETAKAGYFNRDYLEKIIDDHMNYRKDYSRQLCALITFELWRRLFTKQNNMHPRNA